MIRSIRHQIAIPLIAIQLFIAGLTALSAWVFAARQVNSEIKARFHGLSHVLSQSAFPLTPAILTRLHELTDADFLILDRSGEVIKTSLAQTVDGQSFSGRIPNSVQDNQKLKLNGTDFICYVISTTNPAQRVVALYPLSRWQKARQQAVLLPLAQGLGGLLLMTFATNWIAKQMAGRLLQIQSHVARIAGGAFEEPLDESGQADEIQALAKSINQMRIELNQMRNTIQTHERMNILAQIASGLAHQLRNSIAGARIGVQLHLKRCRLNDDTDQSLKIVLAQLQLTQEQLQGLLNWNLTTEHSCYDKINLVSLIEHVISLIRYQADHKQVEISPVFPDHEVIVTGNESEIRTSILSLVQNAIEAAGANGRVGIEIAKNDDSGDIQLKIMDNGPGLQLATNSNLGTAFMSTKPEGLGLGLYLARQVAQRHGGEITWSRKNEITIFEWVWYHENQNPVNSEKESG